MTRELHQIIASWASDSEPNEMINAPVEVLRERYGGNHNDVLSVARDTWNAEGEAEVLATFFEQGVEPAAVKEIINWCTGDFNNALGDPANVENIVALESEFRTIAKPHVLDDGLVNALVKWQRGRIGGGGE